MGRHGINWCEEHGTQLARMSEAVNGQKRTQKAVRPNSPVTVRHVRPEDDGQTRKLPLAVRLNMLVEHVQAAAGPVTRRDAAAAIGFQSPSAIPHILKAGVEQGLLTVKRGKGGGISLGPKAAAAAPKAAATAPKAAAA